MKNITILGGGTSGWLTALYIRQIFPESNIILVKSTDVGILGAGEGSVPTLFTFLNSLKIDEKELLKEVRGTYKMGISFENWAGDGEKYIHGFGPNSLSLNYTQITMKNPISIGLPSTGNLFYLSNLITQNSDWSKFEPSTALCYGNKSPYFKNKNGVIEQSVRYSYHFDAHLLAKYLEKIGVSRGIGVIDNNVRDFLTTENGDIKSVLFENDTKLDCDFIFDCSGFNRLIIGKHYKTKWISYEKYLKVNKAIPFSIDQDSDKITPYTHAIAMKYGWMWKIPLQHRNGCGYVFDDTYITPEEAQKEVEEMLGHKITVPRVLDFNAGRYDNVWVNNCISIGLSAGFTEPIEATSIWIQLTQLMTLDRDIIEYRNKSRIQEYNDKISYVNDDVLSFLYFHYMNKRTDTKFWSDYESRTEIPEFLKPKLDAWKYRSVNDNDVSIKYNFTAFSPQSWLTVSHGNGILNMENLKRENDNMLLDKKIKLFNDNLEKNIEYVQSTSIEHKEFIEKYL
jgi:tryptophan halogenase